MKKILSLILTALLLTGCGQVGAETAPTSAAEESQSANTATPEVQPSLQLIPEVQACIMDEYRINYEIFVRSYCDSDGDGLGDFRGIESKLDYLQNELGVGGLWLMPIHPSPSYHKYDVVDYYSIDPEYGTMEDFESLLEQCQNRGIHVILDLVLNHTSSEHPWFLEASKYLAGLKEGAEPDPEVCPYVDYYHFKREDTCPRDYHPVPGTDRWFYEGHFSPQMPDLNFDSPKVLEEIQKVMDFWLKKGVYGFRLDAVKEYESGRTDRNIEILHWVRETASQIKPNCYLVSEVWDSFGEMGKYYGSGVTSIFNYPFGNSDGKIIKVLKGAGNPAMVSTYAEALQKADSYYRSFNPDYVDAPFLSNHDVGRIAGFAGRDPNKVKLAGAMNLMMSGGVFIYYGEEIGMVTGAIDDPSYRAPMVWSPGAQAVEPPQGCTLPEIYPFGSLQEQREDPNSIFAYYKAAAGIRNALPVLSHGIPEVEKALNKGCVSAVRKNWEEQSCIILMNIDEAPTEVDLTAYSDWNLTASLVTGDQPVELEGESLQLPAWGLAVLTPKK